MNLNVSSVKFFGTSENPVVVITASSEKADEKARASGYRHIREKAAVKI
jgi:hypothetical protein